MSSTNDASVVLRLQVGGTAALLTGDLGKEGEGALLAGMEDFRSRILKVGHHGASTSTGEEFLDRVRPEIAVIQVGKWNSYRHPHPGTLERLRQRGINTFRTDQNGAVMVRFCKGQYRTVTMASPE